MINKQDLIDLFERYEYDLIQVEDDKYAIFSSGTSMYPAVEIVKLADDADEEVACEKKNYSDAGYAVRICEESKIEEIEHYLFNWFFQVKESNSRISIKYKTYTDSVMESLTSTDNANNAKYNYINIPYSVERDFKNEGFFKSGLIESIKNDLNNSGPQLIIIEAGAGFGKTSTAYEILKNYENVEKNIRPFFMELSKDRIAPTFHYLLNSQIDATFKVRLKSDIVLYNIKRGYIPLIIDGFDELLSKDLDNGVLNAKFERVETMLSTIADLLQNQAKVVLTTRKTAIFAGESFYEWYQQLSNSGRCFKISRYQLDSPSIDDWLPKYRTDILPSNFEAISNPVLLGYLRYLDDNTFVKVINESSLTLNYLNSILKREIERQDLPFNTEEQIIILQRLAIYFAGLNSSAFSRSEVKDAIKETSFSILEARSTGKKDVKSLANTLTNHAFLDRKGDLNIGFLNDFIWGAFLMFAINNEKDVFYNDFFKEIPYSILEKSIWAASSFDLNTKEKFWTNLLRKCSTNNILIFWSDVLLIEKTTHYFSDISLDGKSLYSVVLGDYNSNIENCSFSNMTFTDCSFNFNNITNCSFINCRFISCIKEGNNLSSGFYGCKVEGSVDFIDTRNENVDIEEKDEKNHLIELLRLYFKVDERSQRMRMISCIRENFEPSVFKKVFAIAESKGYVICNGDKSFITQAGRSYFNDNKQ